MAVAASEGEPNECGNIDINGVCEGNTLKYCLLDALKVVDCTSNGLVCGYSDNLGLYNCIESCTPSCSGKSCGDDGCGSSCGICGTGESCVSGQCQADDNCGGITYEGTCDGTVLKYCSSNNLIKADCATSGKICAWSTTMSLYVCMDDPNACTPSCSGKACGDDGCGGLCGSCATGESCVSGQCQADDNCGGITYAGTCEGNVLKYCSANTLYTSDCSTSGKTCAWDAANSWYACTANTCTPSCLAKSCGDDGCGGSCGTCGLSETCQSGQCVGSGSTSASCAGKCGEYTTGASCQCDSLCFQYSDCCSDICTYCAADFTSCL